MKTVAAKLLGCSLLLLLVAGFSLAQNEQLDFNLVNKTGVIIDVVNVSPSKSDHWGPDILGRDVLEDGQTCEISFDPEEEAELWDLRIADSEGTSVVWERLDLAKIHTLTLKIVGGKAIAETN